jgi:hypothetical protein
MQEGEGGVDVAMDVGGPAVPPQAQHLPAVGQEEMAMG